MKRMYKLLLAVLLPGTLAGQPQDGYRVPRPEMAAIVAAPIFPKVEFSPAKDYVLLLEYASNFVPVAQLAEPELRLANVRFNPLNNSPSRFRTACGIRVKKVSGDSTALRIRNLPDKLAVGFASWSPDGRKIAFCRFLPQSIELWIIDVPGGAAHRIKNIALNVTLWSRPYAWMPDSRSVLCRAVPNDRGAVPPAPPVTRGPMILESNGEKTASRTYPDLLTNPHEEDLFAYYATSQVYRAGIAGGPAQKIGRPGIVHSFSPSPDGQYILVKFIHRPFSYLVDSNRFPLTVSVYDNRAKFVRTVAELPLLENVPIGRDAALPVARDHAWRPDVPATLYWAEARDGGDPRKKADIRDVVFSLDAPFAGAPREVCRTGLRLEEIIWGNDTLAILVQKWWGDRKVVWTRLNPARGTSSDTLFVYSSENRYTQPGEPERKQTPAGNQVLALRKDGKVLLFGNGASDEGDRPFADLLDLNTKARQRIWQSQPPHYEVGIGTTGDGNTLITRREAAKTTPNYYLRRLAENQCEQVTFVPDPYAGMQGVQHRKIHYARADGIKLTADLYLPAAYKTQDGPLPALLWAYPTEYKEKGAASQVYGSPYRYVGFYSLAMLLATQGYAIIDNATFPVVAPAGRLPNDTYLEQLEANARAAIGEGVRLGVVDSARVAVGGHSYGAFMAANLLTHTRLFKAGIAQSGAYNRTLTPFGFQREERTYWQAPDLYNQLSPFQHADRMATPLLLIHGEADNNVGTFPMQSERYFGALKGLGATVRYVCLPYEGHSYQATESLLHVLWEMHAWMEKHLKPQNQDLATGK